MSLATSEQQALGRSLVAAMAFTSLFIARTRARCVPYACWARAEIRRSAATVHLEVEPITLYPSRSRSIIRIRSVEYEYKERIEDTRSQINIIKDGKWGMGGTKRRTQTSLSVQVFKGIVYDRKWKLEHL